MEDYQTAEDVKEEVVDCGFVEVDSHGVHQLCTACLCATRTTHTLDDVTLKQYYMNILTEMQLEAGEPVLQSPRLCWECVAHLKRSVRFRERVRDSYRLLQPMLAMVDKEDRAEFLQTSVCRPGRLTTCFVHSIDISAQDDDTEMMTATEDVDDKAAVSEYLENNIEARPSTFREIVTTQCYTIDEASFESFCNKDVVVCVSEDLDKRSETDAHTSTQVTNGITVINAPNSTYIESARARSTFICDYCYKRFTSKTALERHITTYEVYPHNNKTLPVPCEDCVVVLCADNQCSECSSGHSLLLQDINIKTNLAENRTGENPFQCECEVCHKSLAVHNEMIRHKRTHTGGKPYQCEVCYKSFAHKPNLIKHIKTHTGEMSYQCEVCHKSFARQGTLVMHISTHTGEILFQCHVCHKSFAVHDELIKHRRTHTGEKPFQCEVCHKSFAHNSNLIMHIRTHTGEKPFQCDVCHKSFAQQSTLATHIRTHTGGKPYQCDVCHKSFALKPYLIKHIRTHTGEKPFQCDVCHKSFAHRRYLIKHIRTHTGGKPYQCEVCHKSFAQKPHLKKHIRTHTGGKPYQCEVCHKSFAQKPHLTKHIRTHTGEKPFQCKVCHKSFAQQSTLVTHIRTHTGGKPYQCEVCHKSFAHKPSLNKHIRTHTGEKPFKNKNN